LLETQVLQMNFVLELQLRVLAFGVAVGLDNPEVGID
jgi:hypothetical protein